MANHSPNLLTPHSNRILQEKHNIDIIVYLYLNGARSRSEIYKGVSTNPRMSDKLDTLQDYGVIRELHPSNRPVFGLTCVGFEYARMICHLEESCGGDIGSAIIQRENDNTYDIHIQRI